LREGRRRAASFHLPSPPQRTKWRLQIGQARRSEIILAKTRSKPPCRRRMGDCLVVAPESEGGNEIGGSLSASGLAEPERLRHAQDLPARFVGENSAIAEVRPVNPLRRDIVSKPLRRCFAHWTRSTMLQTNVQYLSARLRLCGQISFSSGHSSVGANYTKSACRLNGCVR
jgi:hypothetical protein